MATPRRMIPSSSWPTAFPARTCSRAITRNSVFSRRRSSHVMRKLARMIVEDGEGITRVVDVVVKGASSAQDAKLAALAVARSELVKTSWTGGDPNWGPSHGARSVTAARGSARKWWRSFYDGVIAVASGQREQDADGQVEARLSASRSLPSRSSSTPAWASTACSPLT